MSEETQAPEPGASSTHAPDAAALALALSGAGRETADASLHLQMTEMRARNPHAPDAKRHFTRAATLDLTPSEKSELLKAIHG